MKLIKAKLAEVEAAFSLAFAERKTDDVIIFDEQLKRFGLRARASGRRSWIIQYEKWGRSRRVTLGNAAVLTPEQARHLAVQELAKVDLGADVAGDRAEAKIKEKRLLKSVIEQYLAARKPELRESTFRDMTRYLLKTFKRLHHMPIDAIQRADVTSILRDKANETPRNRPAAAAQARSMLTTFFGWARTSSRRCSITQWPQGRRGWNLQPQFIRARSEKRLGHLGRSCRQHRRRRGKEDCAIPGCDRVVRRRAPVLMPVLAHRQSGRLIIGQ